VSVASRRPFVAIVNAATRNYLEDPSYYRPLIKVQKPQITIHVRVSKNTSDFFLDEAFVVPIMNRGRLLGQIVCIFLLRYPFRDLVTALHVYADILGPIIKERTRGRENAKNTEDHQAG